MRDCFFTISHGMYAQLLFNRFGKERVMKELNEFLSLPMFPRFGGGIGITRLIRAMQLSQLLEGDQMTKYYRRHENIRLSKRGQNAILFVYCSRYLYILLYLTHEKLVSYRVLGIQMKVVKDQISINELKQMSEKMFGKLVKAVVDVELAIMAVDAELHVDLESLLLENESEQNNLWGINFHPAIESGQEWVEFDSMINIRPVIGNRTRYVENPQIRDKIMHIVTKLVQR